MNKYGEVLLEDEDEGGMNDHLGIDSESDDKSRHDQLGTSTKRWPDDGKKGCCNQGVRRKREKGTLDRSPNREW